MLVKIVQVKSNEDRVKRMLVRLVRRGEGGERCRYFIEFLNSRVRKGFRDFCFSFKLYSFLVFQLGVEFKFYFQFKVVFIIDYFGCGCISFGLGERGVQRSEGDVSGLGQEIQVGSLLLGIGNECDVGQMEFEIVQE